MVPRSTNAVERDAGRKTSVTCETEAHRLQRRHAHVHNTRSPRDGLTLVCSSGYNTLSLTTALNVHIGHCTSTSDRHVKEFNVSRKNCELTRCHCGPDLKEMRLPFNPDDADVFDGDHVEGDRHDSGDADNDGALGFSLENGQI
jgi:hypothetical protein